MSELSWLGSRCLQGCCVGVTDPRLRPIFDDDDRDVNWAGAMFHETVAAVENGGYAKYEWKVGEPYIERWRSWAT